MLDAGLARVVEGLGDLVIVEGIAGAIGCGGYYGAAFFAGYDFGVEVVDRHGGCGGDCRRASGGRVAMYKCAIPH